MQRFAILALCAAGALITSTARADVASWFLVGAGPSFYDLGAGDGVEAQPALQIDAGMGSAPDKPGIVGGVGRMLPHFGDGVDLALLLRVAPQSFVLGKWGVAADAGLHQRFWGKGSTGGMATVSVGAPFGFTLGVSGAMGTNDAKMLLATLGIDFARLTVHRHSGLDWWRNPYPSPREEREY